MMADVFYCFDHFDQVFLAFERKYLPASNLFESCDDKKYWKRKIVVKRLLKKVTV